MGLRQRIYNIKTSDKASIGVQEVRIGKLVVPTTNEVNVGALHGTGAGTHHPAWQFRGQIPQGSLNGYFVLIGTSAQGLMDLRHSPMGTIMPGIEAHAQAVSRYSRAVSQSSRLAAGLK